MKVGLASLWAALWLAAAPFVSAQEDIVDTAIAAGFETLVTLVDSVFLTSALKKDAPLKTVFAPTDEAFAALPEPALTYLVSQPGKLTLRDILLYHVVGEQLFAADLVGGAVVTTLSGDTVTASSPDGESVVINNSNVVVADVQATNGVIHVIDAVLIPPSLSVAPSIVDLAVSAGFDTLVVAVQNAGLVDVLKNDAQFTVFAPTNDAFASLFDSLAPGAVESLLADVELLTTILLYHVTTGRVISFNLSDGQEVTTLQGSTVSVGVTDGVITVNQATVIAPNNVAFNGIVHAIDSVLIPPGVVLPRDIVQTAIAEGFDTLVAAVTFADLVAALQAPEPLKTVFAPTNEAFAALPGTVLSFLLTEEGKPTLTDILLYHVVGEQLFSTDFFFDSEVITLLGEGVLVSQSGGNILVNEAVVIAADVATTNGVIHVIDSVLLPPDLELPGDIVDVVSEIGIFSTLVSAVQAAGLVDTLKSPGPFTVFAPTNGAFTSLFASLPAGTAEFLFENTDVLSDILLYHVAPRRIAESDLSAGLSIPTVAGSDIVIGESDGFLTANESNIVAADIVALNGLVHVITAVLLPPGFALP